MNKVFGWFGEGVPAELALRELARMAGSAADATSNCTSSSGSAIAIAPGCANASMWQCDGLVAAIVGRVRWQNRVWSELAAASGDAAALARAFKESGERFLGELSGNFAIAVFDTSARRGLIAVDRMGVEAMCYAQRNGILVFGRAADSVAHHPAIAADLDPQQIFNYLYCHMIPSPGTIFSGVSKLLPGQFLSYRDGHFESGFYWRMDYSEDGLSDTARREKFLALLRDSVKRNIDEDKLGTFLSGGTDSSTVTGIVAELRGSVDSYSIGFDAQEFDEMAYARIAARRFGATAHEYYVTPRDVAEAIPTIAGAYDEPFGNASAVPTYYCARLAKQEGKSVLLAGDGGDEIFGGNERYAKQKVFEAYWDLPQWLRKSVIEPVALGFPGGDALPPVRKLRSYIRQARIPLPERLETYNFIEREDPAAVLSPELLAAIDLTQPNAIAREVYVRTNSPSPVDRMMHLDLKQTLADNDLRKVGRMCEIAGIEVRYPFLDDEMVAFSGRLPPKQKVNGVKLRYFFKESLRGFLPDEIITKSKHGFGLPFGLWMKTDPSLMQLAGDSLANLKKRGYVRSEYIDRILALHRGEHASYYGVMIWVMMMLEQWLHAHGHTRQHVAWN